MINFFRKIRYNLMEQNKTGKYLKYAIGEILLVVVGILIALSINNWNENRKIQNNQEKYLLLLKKEALKNLEAIDEVKKNVTFTMDRTSELIKLIDGQHDTISEKYLSRVLSQTLIFTQSLNYENSILSELKTSGELKNITNDNIRNKLVALEPIIDKLKGQEQYVFHDFETAHDFIATHGSIRRVYDDLEWSVGLNFNKSSKNTSNVPILKQQEFENLILDFIGPTYSLLRHYENLETHLKKLIALIEEELEENN